MDVRRQRGAATRQDQINLKPNGRGEDVGMSKNRYAPLMVFGMLAAFRVASSAAVTDSSAGQGATLTEIIVTDEKREERLQDVPVPVTVISGAVLTESSQLRLQDYYTQVPSLTTTNGVQSSQAVSIRGLPSSTILLDDVPLSGVLPDIDPGNLANVEVLRGPQGTLYGANSLGGLIKFVTVEPTSDSVSGRVEAGANSVHNRYDRGYNVRGSVNLPLTPDLAVRAGAFWRQDAGYIDNPMLGIDGINRDVAHGGQLTALW